MNTKGKDTTYTEKVFKKVMERINEKQKDIDLYALFCVGFKTGRNYQNKIAQKKGEIKE